MFINCNWTCNVQYTLRCLWNCCRIFDSVIVWIVSNSWAMRASASTDGCEREKRRENWSNLWFSLILLYDKIVTQTQCLLLLLRKQAGISRLLAGLPAYQWLESPPLKYRGHPNVILHNKLYKPTCTRSTPCYIWNRLINNKNLSNKIKM